MDQRQRWGLGGLSAIATAVVAIIALRHTAQDSRDRSRPMMIAEFRKAENSDATIDLVIRNAGPSVARDVRVKFDPPITLPDNASQLVTPHLVKRYAETIPSVAPGQELTNIWFQTDFRAREEEGKPLPNREPTPEKVRVTITYRSDRSRYTDTFPLDVDVIRMMTYSTSSKSLPGRMESMDKSLKVLGESAREMARAARYVRRDEIREEEAAAIAQMDAFREEQRKRREPENEKA